MLTESSTQFALGLAFFKEFIHFPTTGTEIAGTLLRWSHFVGGITWIGMLYFFNLVNVPLQKALDGDTKKKVNPVLLPKALWYFRWGSVVTVLAGLTYYAMYLFSPDLTGPYPMLQFLIWVVIVIVGYALLFGLYRIPALTKDGRVLAIAIAILMLAMSGLIIYILGNASVAGKQFTNKAISIGVGGALGIHMLSNVWSIIWPAQRRAISAITNGTPAPSADEMRRAFLASRTNTWLSLPLLLFMGTSSHDWQPFSGT